MGPLDALFGIRGRNHQAFLDWARTHNQPQTEDMEYLYNSRLGPMSRMRGNRLDQDGTQSGQPVILDEEHPSHLTVRDWSNVTPDFVGPPQRGLPPRNFRDPSQLGPEPPVTSPLASMFSR